MQQAISIVFRKNFNDTRTTKLMVLKVYIVNSGCVSGGSELK